MKNTLIFKISLVVTVFVLVAGGLWIHNGFTVQEVALTGLSADLAQAEGAIAQLQEQKASIAEDLRDMEQTYEENLAILEAELQRVTKLYELYKNRDAYANDRVIYLTFDDGPSEDITNRILDVLDDYEIKATFFVMGRKSVEHPEIIRRMHAAGHAIGNHSYSHDYRTLYRTLDSFIEDFQAAQKVLYDITGEYPTLYRYPGGSIAARNMAGRALQLQYDQFLWRQGMQHFDWNVDAGDARDGVVTVESIIGQTLHQLHNRQRAILLLHDFEYRQTTVEALPTIIEALIVRGYKFDVLTSTGFVVQHLY